MHKLVIKAMTEEKKKASFSHSMENDEQEKLIINVSEFSISPTQEKNRMNPVGYDKFLLVSMSESF